MNEGLTPAQLNQRDTDRLRGYRELLDFYHGRHWEGHARWGETRLTFNYAKVIIDKITSYLMSGVTLAVDPASDSTESRASAQRAEQALNQVYENNNLTQLEFSPGYVTAAGSEASSGPAYWITAWEHTSAHGKASLILHARDGWNLTKNWRARHQLRWNKTASQMSVKDILTFVLARCGLELTVKSQSPVLDSYYPEFVINPGSQGDAVVRRLLSFVPDVIFIEGAKAYLVNPVADDSFVYAYGPEHAIIEGRYQKGAWDYSRVQVEGYDPVSEEAIISDSFSWSEVDRLYDRLKRLEDGNIGSVSQAEQRAGAYLRQAEIEADSGTIRTPPNCGQQLYDVIDLSDARVGFESEKRRVLGLALVYNPLRGEYQARLSLGAV